MHMYVYTHTYIQLDISVMFHSDQSNHDMLEVYHIAYVILKSSAGSVGWLLHIDIGEAYLILLILL